MAVNKSDGGSSSRVAVRPEFISKIGSSAPRNQKGYRERVFEMRIKDVDESLSEERRGIDLKSMGEK